MRQNKKILSLLGIFIGLALMATQFQNCSDARFSMVNPKGGNGGLGIPDTPVDPSMPTKNVKLNFNQPMKEITNQVDLLFVTDTSSSLKNERNSIANGIEAFINELPDNTDINIGVLLAHGSRSQWTGRLYQKTKEPLILNTKLHSKAEIIEHLRLKLLAPASDDSDGGEMGLYSLTKYLEKSLVVPDQPSSSPVTRDQFIRQNAGLAVVFVSDENDICAVYPAGITPVKDPSGKEEFVKARDCFIEIVASNGIDTTTQKIEYITATNTHNLLKKVKGNSPLIVTGLLYTDPKKVPKGGENEVGYGYLDVIALNNDIPIDLTSDIKKGLEVIGQLVNAKLNLLTLFKLEDSLLTDCADQVLAQTMSVQVDTQPVPFQFLKDSCEVQLDLIHAGGPGSKIDIEFTFKITNF